VAECTICWNIWTAGLLKLDVERRVVDAAAEYLSDEEGGVGFIYSGGPSCTATQAPPDEQPWQVRTDRVSLLV
jgi:hypothetical protein